MLEIHVNKDGDTVVVSAFGKLDAGGAPKLEEVVGAYSGENVNIVLDCADIRYVSSMGIRVLMKANMWTKKMGGSFCLRNVRDAVLETLELTGLEDMISIE